MNARRRGRSEREARRLRTAIAGWTDGFLRDPARFRRHVRQIERLRAVLLGAVARIERRIEGVDTGLATGAFADECARADGQLRALESAQSYYRERLAQRSGPAAAVLEATDEVAWSCYRPLFAAEPPRPPPLSFFDASLPAHWTLEHDRAFSVADPIGGRLGEVAHPPVRLLGVPHWTQSEPWSLALVAHEVGHLAPRELGLRDRAGAVIAAAAGERADAWRGWCDEVVADLFSVAAMGRFAITALAEVLRAAPERMAEAPGDGRYPPAAVRLALMAAFHRARGHELPADEMVDARCAADLKVAGEVAAQVAADPALAPLWPPAIDGLEALVATAPPVEAPATQDLAQPRLLACVLVDQWTTATPPDAERALAQYRAVAASGPPGTRAAEIDAAIDVMVDDLLGALGGPS